MVDVFFADTNVLIDYLEIRDNAVHNLFTKLLQLDKEGKIRLVTSIFNIAELIDKELDIAFYSKCMKQKMSCDEILRLARNRQGKYEEKMETCVTNVESKIRRFIEKNDLTLLCLSAEMLDLEQIFYLGIKNYIPSQDTMIVATALASKATYFLSSDEKLGKKLKVNDLFYVFDLGKEKQREIFRDTVLKAL